MIEQVPVWRVRMVLAFMALGFFALVVKAVELQVFQSEFLSAEAQKRHVRKLLEPGGRGAIRDRHGVPLALSAPTESIWVVPSALLAKEEYIAPLAALLDEDAGKLRRELTARQGRQFYYLRRQMAPSDADRVLELKAPGVFSQREYKRFYPGGEAIAQLVGVTGVDGNGLEGMEWGFDSVLQGAPGNRLVVQDVRGRVIDDLDEYQPSRSGEDLDLSIDLGLQHLAYAELKSAVVSHRAKGGVVLVVDVDNGEILALATQPWFNPNNRADMARDKDAWRNRAALDVFEPGSTVKPLLVAAALENGVVRADHAIDTGRGWMKVGSLPVTDNRGYGRISLETMLVKSSNVGAAKLGLALGADQLFDAYRSFGFSQLTDAGVPGEVSGHLAGPYEWGDVGTATASFGYGMNVTALQLVQAYMVLAADGRRRPISLLKGGSNFPAEQVLRPEVAQQVRRMMAAVTAKGGTATRAAISGYSVAGKTGTVRKVAKGGGYDEKRHQSLFVGMLPAHQPRLLTLVMIDEPQAGQYYGGLVAAPVFSRVVASAARLLQIAPEKPKGLTAQAQTGAAS